MPPIPGDDEMICRNQASEANRNLRNAPAQERAHQAPNETSSRGHEPTLPEKNRADVAPTVAHRSKNGDLLDLGEHCHGQNIEDTETSQQDDERYRDGGRHSQRKEKMASSFLARLA